MKHVYPHHFLLVNITALISWSAYFLEPVYNALIIAIIVTIFCNMMEFGFILYRKKKNKITQYRGCCEK